MAVGHLAPGRRHPAPRRHVRGQHHQEQRGRGFYHSYTRVLDDGVRLVAGFDRNRLKLTVDVVPAEIESQESDGDTLTVTLRSRVTAPAGKFPTALRIDHEPSGFATDLPLQQTGTGDDGWLRHTAKLPLAGLPTDGVTPGKTRKYRALIVFADGTTRRATNGEKLRTDVHPLPDGRELAVLTDGAGNFTPQLRTVQPVVDSVRWSADGELELAGSYTGPAEQMKMVLRHTGRNEDRPLPVEFADGRFTARLRPDTMETYEGTVPLRGRPLDAAPAPAQRVGPHPRPPRHDPPRPRLRTAALPPGRAPHVHRGAPRLRPDLRGVRPGHRPRAARRLPPAPHA